MFFVAASLVGNMGRFHRRLASAEQRGRRRCRSARKASATVMRLPERPAKRWAEPWPFRGIGRLDGQARLTARASLVVGRSIADRSGGQEVGSGARRSMSSPSWSARRSQGDAHRFRADRQRRRLGRRLRTALETLAPDHFAQPPVIPAAAELPAAASGQDCAADGRYRTVGSRVGSWHRPRATGCAGHNPARPEPRETPMPAGAKAPTAGCSERSLGDAAPVGAVDMPRSQPASTWRPSVSTRRGNRAR